MSVYVNRIRPDVEHQNDGKMFVNTPVERINYVDPCLMEHL